MVCIVKRGCNAAVAHFPLALHAESVVLSDLHNFSSFGSLLEQLRFVPFVLCYYRNLIVILYSRYELQFVAPSGQAKSL